MDTNLNFYLAKRSYETGIPSADGGVCKITKDGNLFFALFDVAGHGAEANMFTRKVAACIAKNFEKDLAVLVGELHDSIRGSRGLVGAFCRLTLKKRLLEYISIGNIGIRIVGRKHQRILPQQGIIGYTIKPPVKTAVALNADDLIIMYTDGVKDHFDIAECKGFLDKDAKTVSKNILKMFNKRNDDAAVLAVRFQAT